MIVVIFYYDCYCNLGVGGGGEFCELEGVGCFWFVLCCVGFVCDFDIIDFCISGYVGGDVVDY